MPRSTTSPARETQRRKALARWEDEGGAEPCGPQVPGVAKDCADEETTAAPGTEPKART